eukprot:1932278-Pyramimonas_sp.AAC.1
MSIAIVIHPETQHRTAHRRVHRCAIGKQVDMQHRHGGAPPLPNFLVTRRVVSEVTRHLI